MSSQNERIQKFNFVISTNRGRLYSGSFGVQIQAVLPQRKRIVLGMNMSGHGNMTMK
jgi:hypothetical protein